MNLITIKIKIDPMTERETYLQSRLHTRLGSKTWRGRYRGTALRAELGGVWLALRELGNARLYKCLVEVQASKRTREIINDFLWQTPTSDLADVYEHLRPLMKKHTILIPSQRLPNPTVQLTGVISKFQKRHPQLRTRLPRAAQLISMNALRRNDWGYQCASQTSPQWPYSIWRLPNGCWHCNCPDSGPLIKGQKACKHILAVKIYSHIQL